MSFVIVTTERTLIVKCWLVEVSTVGTYMGTPKSVPLPLIYHCLKPIQKSVELPVVVSENEKNETSTSE